MFRERTVLILGAGASAPYGYPLGPGLIKNIAEELAHFPSSHSAFSGDDLTFSRNPAKAAFLTAQWLKPEWLDRNFYTAGAHAWKQLGEQLLHDSCPSIDEFARVNPRYKGAIKLLIASEIAHRTYDHDGLNTGRLLPNAGLISNLRMGWYGKLLTHLRRHNRSADAFDADNPLVVVTFNYDRSLELFLEFAMSRGELYNGVRWQDAVSIIHLHGAVECAPLQNGRTMHAQIAEGVLASAEQMLVVDDRRRPQDPAKVAIHYLDQADHAVAIGFDFLEQNVALLSLENYARKMRALNFAGAPGFDRRVKRLGLLDDNVFSKRGQDYQIITAIDDGLFEV